MADPTPYLDDAMDKTRESEAQQKLVVELIGAAADRDGPLIRKLLIDQHPADIADAIEQLNYDQQALVCELCPDLFTGEVLAELVEDTRASIVDALEAERIAEALEVLDSDDKTQVVEELDDKKREAVLAAMPDEDRQVLEASLACDDETAGRLMQREFVAAPLFWTVGDAIDHMRKAGEDLPDLFFEIFIVDEAFRPVGAAPVSAQGHIRCWLVRA